MPTYPDHNRDCPPKSGITHIFPGHDYIDITFKNNKTYRYTAEKLGQAKITKMKRLAADGDCLNTYLNQNREILDSAYILT
jgi:hypothetical protein